MPRVIRLSHYHGDPNARVNNNNKKSFPPPGRPDSGTPLVASQTKTHQKGTGNPRRIRDRKSQADAGPQGPGESETRSGEGDKLHSERG